MAFNDKAIALEEEAEEEKEHGARVTLDNVFDLAAKQGANNDESDGESDDDDSDEEDKKGPNLGQSSLIADSDLLKSTPMSDYETKGQDPSRQDQGLVRPKVLILAPFKQMAYQIIE